MVGGLPLSVPLGEKVAQAGPGGGQGGIGAVLPQAAAGRVPAQIHADIVHVPRLVE